MNRFAVIISKRALKDLTKLDAITAKRIIVELENLSTGEKQMDIRKIIPISTG